MDRMSDPATRDLNNLRILLDLWPNINSTLSSSQFSDRYVGVRVNLIEPALLQKAPSNGPSYVHPTAPLKQQSL